MLSIYQGVAQDASYVIILQAVREKEQMDNCLIDKINKIKEEHPEIPLALIADIVESEAKRTDPVIFMQAIR